VRERKKNVDVNINQIYSVGQLNKKKKVN